MPTSTEYQKARAHELVFKNAVAFDSDLNEYHVKSMTEKNKIYLVMYSPRKKSLICECKGFEFNKNCSHCAAIRVFQRNCKN